MWKKKNQKRQEEEPFVRSRFHSLLFFILITTVASAAEHSFYFNTNLLVAQKQNYELRLDRAQTILLEEQVHDQHNSAVHYLLHLNAFFKAFISEDTKEYASYLKVRDKALLHYQSLSDTSAFKKYAEADAYFYSAAIKAKFEEFYGAARDVNRAYSLIEENHEEFPNFAPNNKIRGVVKVYLSTVPDNYAWVVRLLGIRGNLTEGLNLLKNLSYTTPSTKEQTWMVREASYLYSFSLMHVAHRPYKAWTETLRCTQDYTTNLLSSYFRSTMALRLSKNDVAISVLNNRPTSKEFVPFYYLDYQLGVAKQQKLDSSAIVHFEKFDKNYTGRNYVKSNLQKMSWHYTLVGNENLSTKYKKRILTEGIAINEEDKQALLFAKKPNVNSKLLAARVLYDGGYVDRANRLLAGVNVKTLPNNSQKAEYCYRRGRILEKQKNRYAANKYYEACSLYALESREYYGAYASIYLGEYYLGEGENQKAELYFTRALGYDKNREYTSSIEQRAKAGSKKLN